MNKFLKILVTTLILSSVAIYFSCNKSHIDLLPHGQTELTYFTTENEFTQGVYGVYAKLVDLYAYSVIGQRGPGQLGDAGFDQTLMPIYLLMGDDITTNSSNAEFETFGSLQSSSGRVTNFYVTLYQLIARANVLLEKNAAAGSDVYTTPNLKEIHRGEALFLRGFAYYYLWNYFGTAPLNLERVTSNDQFTPPGTTGTQLLDQAINDFTEASTLLPATWGTADRGRVTKNSAFGFLGKCLVFRASATKTAADYTAAITAFNNVTGVSLVPKFDDNFALDTENNPESLFEFQASKATGQNNVWLPNDFDNAVGDMAADWQHYKGVELYDPSAQFYATTKLQDAFDDADPRKDLTLNDDRTINKYVLRDDERIDGYIPASADNYRILRYADVLLLKAEAILQSGGSTSQAIDLVNQVRTRAREMVGGGTVPANYSTSETNKETVMLWIMNERLLELAGEGQRWLDIRRWQMQGIITLNNAFFSSNVTVSFQNPKQLFLPIPTRELDVNPNVQQNPGY
jgi:hypothetical protein